jgi:apolipoprotein D and lipocalin family protein
MADRFPGILFLTTLIVLGCTGVPKGIEPVSDFDGDRYMGRWYEIARLNHSFERNLSNVSAMCTAQEDGMILVENQGYNEKTGEWKQIEGKARFIHDGTFGSLKASFLGPFYGGYHVIELDREKYSYAMVSGPSRSYLWILSRTSELDEAVYSGLLSRAAELGFDTKALLRVKHDRTAKNLLAGEKIKMASTGAGKLAPCPKSPNCVSSLAEDKKHFIAPIPYRGDNAATRQKLLEILNSFKGARVVSIEKNYIHAEFVSSLFRFVDDVEFYLNDAVKVIHVKSASRTGYYDFGVNRRRVELIRKKFEEGAMG